MTDKSSKNIYEALQAVYLETGYVQKTGENKAQNYKYAGESALLAAIRPSLVKHNIIVFPSSISEASNTVTLANGKQANRVLGNYVFSFHHSPTGTFTQVSALGEGVDTGDKASYKAATGALKYALRQMFLIETGDEPEADEDIDKPGVPEFKNAALRKTYCDNVIKAFEGAESQTKLRELAELYKPKLTAMRKGGEHDQLAAEELGTRYLACERVLKMHKQADDGNFDMPSDPLDDIYADVHGAIR